MQLLLSSILLASAALAAPVANPDLIAITTTISTTSTPTPTATPLAYTAAINPTSHSEPPPLWDPQVVPPPPIFDAPTEDPPRVPVSLVSVHEAPVQSVRIEKLIPFTASTVQPEENIYRASPSDPEGHFHGEGSLRPAARTLAGCVLGFLSAWAWWISVVAVACVLVYIAEKMLIGAVRGARRARSASRVARSRAVSLVGATRSRAASMVRGGRSRAGTMNLGAWSPLAGAEKKERSRSPPPRSRSWDETVV